MKIGLDLDGVVFDFATPFLAFFNLMYSRNVQMSDWSAYHLYDCGICTKKEEDDCFEKFADMGSFRNLEIIDNANIWITKLRKNHEIYFITSRPVRTQVDTLRSLNYYYLNLPVITTQKSNFPKWKVCEQLHIDTMVDDKLEWLQEMDNIVKVKIPVKILFRDKTQPRQQDLPGDKTIITVTNKD